ncbi:MAG: methylornithine synthase PylB [Deltaproteobacteria bacterium]|jgi:methylornithine synthase|nr:methylornithine synthase PylB [Deltaproteobacteria bacterium]
MPYYQPVDPAWVRDVVDRALGFGALEIEELAILLGISPDDHEAASIVFEGARRIRDQIFGSKVFLYGFVYLSTFCHNDCSFCNYRVSRQGLERYRKSPDQIFEAAVELAKGGVHLIDLTLGEDEAYLTGQGLESLLGVAGRITAATGLPIMLSPGVLDGPRLGRVSQAGITWYALYQETHNRRLFRRLRRSQDFDLRMEAKDQAQELGLLVEDGVMVGAGATSLDLAHSIKAMDPARAQQVRAMTYVPVVGGLPERQSANRTWQEFLMLACLRLSHPHSLIPASLDVDGLDGLMPRLAAGANVVTSLVPPEKGLVGVASMKLDIDNRNRDPQTVIGLLSGQGYVPGTHQDYRSLIEGYRRGAGRA